MASPAQRQKVLFVCTGNTCRSQIAEGLAKTLYPAEMESYSAGVEASRLNEKAVAIMKEKGVDISYYESKALTMFDIRSFDLIVTLSERARKHLGSLGKTETILHIPCPSPIKHTGAEDDVLHHYRVLRELIQEGITRRVLTQL